MAPMPRPAPLPIADFGAAARTRSFSRGYAALALGMATQSNPHEILRGSFADDDLADLVVKAGVSATGSANFLKLTRLQVLGSIAPGSAVVRLFNAADVKVDLDGLYAVKVPYGSTVPQPVFVGENQQAPIGQGVLEAGAQIGPTKKLVVVVVCTREIEFLSVEAFSIIMQRMLTEQAHKNLDAEVFSATAASDIRDAGLLNGVSPLSASTASGQAAMAADVGSLAGALGAAGCDSNRMMLFANAAQATALKLMAGPAFTNPIVACNALSAGTVVAIDPAAIGVGYAGTPEIDVAREATVVMQQDNVQEISAFATPNVVAYPTVSLFQQDLLAIRLRMKLTYAPLVPGAVQTMNSVKW